MKRLLYTSLLVFTVSALSPPVWAEHPHGKPRPVAMDMNVPDFAIAIDDLGLALTAADPHLTMEVRAYPLNGVIHGRTYLALNGQQVGSDREVYIFRALITTVPDAAVELLQDWLLPLREASPAGFRAGLTFLRTRIVVSGYQTDWEGLIDDLNTILPPPDRPHPLP